MQDINHYLNPNRRVLQDNPEASSFVRSAPPKSTQKTRKEKFTEDNISIYDYTDLEMIWFFELVEKIHLHLVDWR